VRGKLLLLRPQLVKTTNPGTHIWERQDSDTDRAWEAFEIYRQMGTHRSYQKVAAQLGKSRILIERWARRDNWQMRVLAWDRYESRVVNERVMLGTASMRERQVVAAMALQARAQNRLLHMTAEEMDKLRPVDVCAMCRKARKDCRSWCRSLRFMSSAGREDGGRSD
jgi:hypothetical protein